MMCLALKLLLCILADSQLFVGVRLIPFGSNLFPSGCRSPPSPPHPMRPPSCHTPALHLHVITLLFPFPSFPLLSLSVCFMKKRIEFGMCFFFSQDYILRGFFGRSDVGVETNKSYFCSSHHPVQAHGENQRKCMFHTAILGSTVFFSRSAYSPRLRTCTSPTPKAEILASANPLAPCYALPPTLSFLQVPGTGSTGALPRSGVFPPPQAKNDGRARIRRTRL